MSFRINNTPRGVPPKHNPQPPPKNNPPPQKPPQNIAVLNTHHYDGKLNVHPLLKIVQEQQENVTIELTTEKQSLFASLVEDVKLNPAINNRYRPTAIQAINKINQNIRQPPNYDRTNNTYADDILYLVCKKIAETKDTNILVYLAEQLSDIITSGSCAQGRNTRVFQVLFSCATF